MVLEKRLRQSQLLLGGWNSLNYNPCIRLPFLPAAALPPAWAPDLLLPVLVGHGDPVGVSSHRGEAPWKGQQLCPLTGSLAEHPELQGPWAYPAMA